MYLLCFYFLGDTVLCMVYQLTSCPNGPVQANKRQAVCLDLLVNSGTKAEKVKLSTLLLRCNINQIRVVAFVVPKMTQASFLQKSQTLQNDICNTEMAQSLSSLQKSEFLKLIPIIGIQLFKKNQISHYRASTHQHPQH